MSPRESNVRISIVVPYLGNDAAFEESLVSVLENRPEDAEICVVHDGTYCDPFDLGDEVRFVTATGSDLPTLIASAAAVARGRVVHLISDGVRATHGWTDAALYQFEQAETAVVAPLVRTTAEGNITAAGWTDAAVGVTAPVAAGKAALGRRDQARVRGAYLAASFWRKDELVAVTNALRTADRVAAEFAWCRLLTTAGWRCTVADESLVLGDPAAVVAGPSFSRGMTLRGLAAEIDERAVWPAVMMATLGSAFSPATWLQTAGQACVLLKEPTVVRMLRFEQVRGPEEVADTIAMPAAAPAVRVHRQAA